MKHSAVAIPIPSGNSPSANAEAVKDFHIIHNVKLPHTKTGYIFERFESKYLLPAEKYFDFKNFILQKMKPDAYGLTTIQSLYYDTDSYLLIRNSLEKPVFKEKLRLRCYGLATQDSKIYFEIKRKYNGIVYKRRLATTQSQVENLLFGREESPSQIAQEIAYFDINYQGLEPKVLIISEREAFADEHSDLRITIDKNIRYRNYDLSLDKGFYGEAILPQDRYLMEVKTSSAYPLWLVNYLSKNKIYKSSFSKYGTAYLKMNERKK